MTPQTARALVMRLQGATYAQIGADLRVSRQRAQQMLSPTPATLALVRARADGRCENCGFGSLTLAVHHRTVDITADAYNESSNLQVLCVSCHTVAHAGPPREIDETGKDPHAVALGRKGGKASSPAKTAAVRANGRLGGRPKKG